MVFVGENVQTLKRIQWSLLAQGNSWFKTNVCRSRMWCNTLTNNFFTLVLFPLYKSVQSSYDTGSATWLRRWDEQVPEFLNLKVSHFYFFFFFSIIINFCFQFGRNLSLYYGVDILDICYIHVSKYTHWHTCIFKEWEKPKHIVHKYGYILLSELAT